MKSETGFALIEMPERGFALIEMPERGFALIEMLVAMVLLSLVGLTLARFQSFQLMGTANIATAAAARLTADNVAIDILAAPDAPTTPQSGTSANAGREWAWAVTPGPSPDLVLMPDMVTVEIAVSAGAGGPMLVRRQLLRPRTYARDPEAAPPTGGARAP